MPTDDRPTGKQQRYLRSLAQKTGTSFTPPQTKAEASREIERLRQLGASPGHERREDSEAVAKNHARRRNTCTAVRGDRVRLQLPVDALDPGLSAGGRHAPRRVSAAVECGARDGGCCQPDRQSRGSA